MPITTAVKVALNSINSPRLVINADHVIEYANEAFVQQFGNNDCHGKPCHAVIFEREKPCHEYGFHCPLHEAQISLKPATSRQTLIDTAGSHHWELEVSPVLGTDGRPQFYIEAIERRANFVTPLSGQGIVAKSESTQAVLNRIKKLSLFKMPVLLIGFYKEIWHAFRPKLNTSLQTLHTIESLKDERTSFKPDGFSFSREQ